MFLKNKKSAYLFSVFFRERHSCCYLGQKTHTFTYTQQMWRTELRLGTIHRYAVHNGFPCRVKIKGNNPEKSLLQLNAETGSDVMRRKLSLQHPSFNSSPINRISVLMLVLSNVFGYILLRYLTDGQKLRVWACINSVTEVSEKERPLVENSYSVYSKYSMYTGCKYDVKLRSYTRTTSVHL